MNEFAVAFLLINLILLLILPRRFAPLPLLIGACYIVRNQGIDIGTNRFTVLRILIAGGILRVIIRREWPAGGINGLDKMLFLWAGWAIITGFFHPDPSAALKYRFSLAYDSLGIYFLFRIFCQTFEDVELLCRLIAITLIPVALEMIYEKLANRNLFNMLGGGDLFPDMRDGKLRARGPFAHAILGGTIGAVCLPFMSVLWHKHRKEALLGIFACMTMVITSTSSGPILSVMAAIGALYLWRYKHEMRVLRIGAIVGYILLDIIMIDPAYFILARIDLTGSSTGWHRARLIQSSIEHLSEWWVVGTNYTRHWMPTGVSWSPDHSDITNHYLQMGVIGGLPLMILFIAVLIKGFSFVGQAQRMGTGLPKESCFMVWAMGASLFTHAVTFTSVSYFDQSFMFIFLTLATIGSIGSLKPA